MANHTTIAKDDGAKSGALYSTFYVGGLYFGIEVLKVQEVLRYQEMTRVPVAPGVIEGLMNLRGQIVTAVDMRRRLNIEPRSKGQTPMNIVVRSDEGAVSLLVDEIGDVVEAPIENYERPPETMRPEARDLIDGVYKLADRLMLVLNTDRVLQIQPNPTQKSNGGFV